MCERELTQRTQTAPAWVQVRPTDPERNLPLKAQTALAVARGKSAGYTEVTGREFCWVPTVATVPVALDAVDVENAKRKALAEKIESLRI